MPNYPPRLVNITAADRGSILLLDDSSRVIVDVSPERLDAAIVAQGASPLAQLVADQSLGVYVDTLDMTAEVWDRVSSHLCRSPHAAEAVEPFRALWAAVHAPYPVVAEMPQRVYGGITHWSMYTSCPINFRGDPNRPAPWRRALLSDRGGWLFQTWVHLEGGQVEIEAFQRPGHYVE